jgi:hypothetical protein
VGAARAAKPCCESLPAWLSTVIDTRGGLKKTRAPEGALDLAIVSIVSKASRLAPLPQCQFSPAAEVTMWPSRRTATDSVG